MSFFKQEHFFTTSLQKDTARMFPRTLRWLSTGLDLYLPIFSFQGRKSSERPQNYVGPERNKKGSAS